MCERHAAKDPQILQRPTQIRYLRIGLGNCLNSRIFQAHNSSLIINQILRGRESIHQIHRDFQNHQDHQSSNIMATSRTPSNPPKQISEPCWFLFFILALITYLTTILSTNILRSCPQRKLPDLHDLKAATTCRTFEGRPWIRTHLVTCLPLTASTFTAFALVCSNPDGD